MKTDKIKLSDNVELQNKINQNEKKLISDLKKISNESQGAPISHNIDWIIKEKSQIFAGSPQKIHVQIQD